MSADNINVLETSCCASCGVAGVDEIKLKKCKGCYLVRYCGVKCQRDHWRHHKRACRNRAAELRDELLFKHPESTHRGDCPICCLPLPLDSKKLSMYACCSKVMCNGCDYANQMQERKQRLKHGNCPFCRKPLPKTQEEADKLSMKRVKANNPAAMCKEGATQSRKGDYIKAFDYYTKAAELGDVEAHFKLALSYQLGQGVEKNMGKEIHYMEEAAIGGHPKARYCLGCIEWENGSKDRAVKHWTIAATHGDDDSVKILTEMFKEGFVSKEDLASALRAHQAAVNATKSPQREAAERGEKY
jgi:hypothetical protein